MPLQVFRQFIFSFGVLFLKMEEEAQSILPILYSYRIFNLYFFTSEQVYKAASSTLGHACLTLSNTQYCWNMNKFHFRFVSFAVLFAFFFHFLKLLRKVFINLLKYYILLQRCFACRYNSTCILRVSIPSSFLPFLPCFLPVFFFLFLTR